MSFENDIERSLNQMGNKAEHWATNNGQTLGKNLQHGFRQLKGIKYLKKNERMQVLGNIGIVALISLALLTQFDQIIKILPDLKKMPPIIAEALNSPYFYKFLAAVVPIGYLAAIGSKHAAESETYKDKFEMVSLSSGSKKVITDEFGNKTRVMAFPELIRRIEIDEDTTMFLFAPNGNSLDSWKKKREALEQVFDTNIYKLEYTKGGKNAIQMVCVTNEKKAELIELLEEQKQFNEKFSRIGLVGRGERIMVGFGGIEEKIKNYPEYVSEESTTINGKKVITYTFRSEGTEIQNWREKNYLIENVLNLIVVDIKQDDKDKQLYRVTTISNEDDLKAMYEWDDSIIDEEDGVIILGEGLLEKVKVNLNNLPHMLIGGTTGSGKSVLTNCIAWQTILKGCILIGIDFKGGVELEMLSPFTQILFERKKVIDILDKLVKEHEARLEEFKQVGVKNIADYNNKVADALKMARIVILIDEIAEMLGLTGDKEIDSQIATIEGSLNTLARLSRATGINIITATQRPDAKVLGGQIKNNLPIRVCGRMIDPQPSIMVLDSPDATRIPEEIKGRYMMNTGSGIKTFQAYFFKESSIKPGDYVKGRTLVLSGSSPKINRKNTAIVESYNDEGGDDFEDDDPYEGYEGYEEFEEYENNEGGDNHEMIPEVITFNDLKDDEPDQEEVL